MSAESEKTYERKIKVASEEFFKEIIRTFPFRPESLTLDFLARDIPEPDSLSAYQSGKKIIPQTGLLLEIDEKNHLFPSEIQYMKKEQTDEESSAVISAISQGLPFHRLRIVLSDRDCRDWPTRLEKFTQHDLEATLAAGIYKLNCGVLRYHKTSSKFYDHYYAYFAQFGPEGLNLILRQNLHWMDDPKPWDKAKITKWFNQLKKKYE